MKSHSLTKTGHRLHLIVPAELFEEIEDCVTNEGTSLADFCREAMELSLHEKRRKKTRQQILETCKIFEQKSKEVLKELTK
jgi:hypothetical protein